MENNPLSAFDLALQTTNTLNKVLTIVASDLPLTIGFRIEDKVVYFGLNDFETIAEVNEAFLVGLTPPEVVSMLLYAIDAYGQRLGQATEKAHSYLTTIEEK